jgi:hypothetical protein
MIAGDPGGEVVDGVGDEPRADGQAAADVGAGEAFGDQWPGSRAIAAEKAFTADAFSLPGFALSTANLYWPTQPENSLYALATSNPVHEEAFYVGEAETWGTENAP